MAVSFLHPRIDALLQKSMFAGEGGSNRSCNIQPLSVSGELDNLRLNM